MAIVVKPFPGVPDGDTEVRQFEPGDQVHGDLAKVALAEGWAAEGGADERSEPGISWGLLARLIKWFGME